MLAIGSAALAIFAAGTPPYPPVFGIMVTPETTETLVREAADPVASRCGALARDLAAQTHGAVGDVSISSEEGGGTVWQGRLLMIPEPPLIVRMRCTKTRFEVGERSFDPASPPSPLPW